MTRILLAAGIAFAQSSPDWDMGAAAKARAASESLKAIQERREAFSKALQEAGEVSEFGFPGAPEGQPRWHYLTKPLAGAKAVRRRLPEGWHLDTTGQTKDSAGFFSLRVALPGGIMNRPKIDRHEGFSIRFRLTVHSEAHVSPQRAGMSLIVIGEDLMGVELGFWRDEVWAQRDDPLFTHGEGTALATGETAEYELRLKGDRYELYAAGRKVLEGPLKNYSSFGFPYDRRSFLFYGDDTSSAAADVEVLSLRVAYGLPAPGVANASFSGSARGVPLPQRIGGGPAPLENALSNRYTILQNSAN